MSDFLDNTVRLPQYLARLQAQEEERRQREAMAQMEAAQGPQPPLAAGVPQEQF